jgi:hypothetical protein
VRRSAALIGLVSLLAACGGTAERPAAETPQAQPATGTTAGATRRAPRRPRKPAVQTVCAPSEVSGYRTCSRTRGIRQLAETIERRDGRARIWILDGEGCWHAHPAPGRYLVDPATRTPVFVAPLPEPYGS